MGRPGLDLRPQGLARLDFAQLHHQAKVITEDEQRRAVEAVIAFVGDRFEPPLSGTW